MKTSYSYVILAILLTSVGIVFCSVAQTQPLSADTIGYFFAGQQLANDKGLAYTDTYNQTISPFFYPHAFRMTHEDSATAFFGYPPGLPILIAIAGKLTGNPQFAAYTVPALATLGVLVTWGLGWLLTGSKSVGLWAAALLVSARSYWTFGTAPWSEIPSLVFISCGVAFYILSRRNQAKEQLLLTYAAAAGLLIGFSFFIRYTNVLLVCPVLFLFELTTSKACLWQKKERWLFWIILTMSVLGILLFNNAYYGGPFNTIYNTPKLGAYPWPMFSLTYAFGPSPANGYSVLEIFRTLWNNFHVFLFLAPWGWLHMSKTNALLDVGMILTTIGLFSIYAFAAKGANARFLLPMFPFLCIAIAYGIIMLGHNLPPNWTQRLLVGLVMILLFAPIPMYVNELQIRNRQDAMTVERIERVTMTTPENAVFLSLIFNDAIIVYGRRSVLNYRAMIKEDPQIEQFDMATYRACFVASVEKLLMNDIPVYFVLHSGWNASKIMEEHFALTEASQEMPLMQVTLFQDEGEESQLGVCPVIQ